VVEVTEHERVDDYQELRRAIEGLGPGVRVSVDDAGSGYSSLRHVLSLRPHYVKLDRDWITGIDVDPVRQTLVLGLVRFVEELGAQIVAEGIETDAELAAARRLGVHLGQGDLLGRPRPADEHATRARAG
jgi:EAL domain-containing protein (putative c-di-GMP-specific phosphodiesterase class I)